MSLKQVIEKAFYMDELIESESTGKASELAAKLKMSERHVYNYLRVLNEIGKVNTYDESKRSYIYKDTP